MSESDVVMQGEPATQRCRAHRYLTLTLSFIAGLVLFSCGGAQVAPPSSGDPAVAGGADTRASEFPWPAELGPPQQDVCRTPEQRVRTGLALWGQLWLAANCVLHRLPLEDQAEFVERVREFQVLAERSRVTIYAYDLPADLKGDYAATGGVPTALVDVYVVDQARHAALASYSAPQLGMGAWRGLCVPWETNRGHSEATLRALDDLSSRGFTFSSEARRVIADAAQDPDFFSWADMAAHAQTQADAWGRPLDTQGAKLAFMRFLASNLRKSADACTQPGAGDDAIKRALYWLGFALHSVQDLAAHRGRTNPEHAYNAEHELNPDKTDEAFELAVQLTTEVADHALRSELKSCVSDFGAYDGGAVSPVYKLEALGLRFDNSPQALYEYLQSAKLFEHVRADPGVRVRWFGDTSDPIASSCASIPGVPPRIDHDVLTAFVSRSLREVLT